MKTKLDYYRMFYETARFHSFSTAAQHLYISQSAISQCIHQLEKELDVQLFVRTRKGVSLTNEGKLLFAKVENAINSIEQGEKQLERLRHLESGEITIAAGDTITTHYLLKYLEEFHALYPDIRIEMANSYSSQMISLSVVRILQMTSCIRGKKLPIYRLYFSKKMHPLDVFLSIISMKKRYF